MKTNRYILVFACVLWCAVGNLFAVEKSYYNSLDGKSGSALREAMTTLLYNKHTTGLGYNWVFDGIDWDSEGNVYDIYSDCGHTKNDETSSYKCCCDAINREHVVPQSTFESQYPQYADRHHLFVVDGKVNGYRSDYAFGECSGGTKGTCSNSSTVKPSEGTKTCSNHEYGKLGTSTFSEVSISDKVYEPKDEFKGDIARAIMYMVVRYATASDCKVKSGSGTGGNSYPVTAWSASSKCGLMFSSSLSTNYGLSAYGKALLMKWHRADPPSAREIARNNGVEAKQGNRNPFIDLPDLAEYLWGTHAGEAVALSSLDIATGSSGGGSSTYQVILNRHGATQTITCTGTYTLPTSSTEVAACEGWPFAGWTTSSNYSSTTAPAFTTSVSAATTLYAVYSNTVSSAPKRKAATADVSTLTFTAACGGSGTADDGAAWTVTSDGAESNFDNTAGIHYGTNSKNVTYVQLSTSDIGGTITQVVVNCRDAQAKATVSVTVGGTAFTCSGSTTATNTSSDYTFTGSASGAVVVRVDRGSSMAKAIYVKSVAVTYTSAGGGGGTTTTTTYKTSPDCGTAHTISLSNGGSATGGDFVADVTEAYSGATVTLTAYPNEGYSFTSWTVTKAGGGEVSVTNNQFTMPDDDVTVSATFTENQKYTIQFYNNGSVISTQSVYKDGEPDVPTNPETCEGYTFVGWWTSTLAASNTTEQDWITDFTVSGAQDYYAIYTHTETSSGGGGSTSITKTMSSFTAVSGNVDGDANVSYEAAQGNAGTAPAVNGSEIRIYQNGGTLTITANNSKKITSVTIGSSMGTTVTYSVDGGTASSNQSISANGTTTVSGINATTVLFTCTGTSKTTRLYLNSLSVTYSSESGGSSSTTYYTSSPNCNTPQDVTVTFNANGGTGTMANQTVSYNTATALTANSFTRTGYTFQGWATSANGEKVYNDQQSVTLTSDVSLYAVWKANSHNVAFTPSPTGATVTINGASTSPQSADYNSTVTITVTPAAHYTISAITASGASGSISLSGTGNSRTFTMPDENVTVSVTMAEDAKYTINWYVADTPSAETNYAGEVLAGIDASETECNGKVFVGWTATADYSNDTEAPADMFTDPTSKTMPSANTNYYAVFATAATSNGGGTATVVDKLTRETTGATSNTYIEWSDKTVTSSAVYSGNSAGDKSSIQLRSNNSNSGIITTASGGKAAKVTVEWQSDTSDDRVLNVYGKSTAYTAATDLYSSTNAGTLIGTIAKKTATELAISNDYEYIGIRSASGAIYLTSVSVTWAAAGGGSTTAYSGYTTSCAAPTLITITFNANGGTGTMANQTVSYNTAAALTANTFTRTGYTFQGWATSADGAKVYNDEANVTLTENTTLYAVWTVNSYTITTNAGTGGTLSTSPSGSANFGTTVTITATPDGTHTLGGITVKDATNNDVSVSGTGNERTFTMPASNVTVSATFNEKQQYSISFFDKDGQIGSTQSVYEGNLPDIPETLSSCNDYEFVGWWTEAITSETTSAQIWVNDFTARKDQAYYAVYSRTTTSGEPVLTNKYKKITTTDELATGNYLIVAYNNGYNAMSATWKATYYLDSKTVTPDAKDIITTTDGTIIWNITVANNLISIYNETSKYLYIEKSTSGTKTYYNIKLGNNTTDNKFTYSVSQGNWLFTSLTFSDRVLEYYSSQTRWAYHTAADAPVYLYKQLLELGSTTYYTSSPVCVVPCSITPTMSFANTEVALTTDDASYTQAVTISGKGSGQTVAYSSSDETVATVNASGVVTLLGKVGSTTITASVAEDGDYCEASASYTITVTQAVCALTSITLNTSTVTTSFTTGDTFTSAGLVVTANYSNCASAIVTPISVSSPDMSTAGEKTIIVTYTENEITKTATYTITVNAPVSYTITLDNNGSVTGGTFTASAASATAGTTITLTATAATGYRFVSWSVTQGNTSVEVTNNQFTMPAGDVTVSATFEAIPQYVIRFFNNGSQIGSNQSVYEGSLPIVPENPTTCDGYTFVGWWTEELASTNTESKTWVDDFTVSKAQDYYAIFSHTEGSCGGSSTVIFEKSDFSGSGTISASKSGVIVSCVGNIPNGAYVTFTENNTLTITSSSGNITAIDFTCTESAYTGNMEDVSNISTSSWSISVDNPGNKTTVRVSSIVVTIGSGSSSNTYYTSSPNCVVPCTKLETPVVAAVAGNGQITLTWADVEGAEHYTVTIGTGVGYTTECGSAASVGTITHSGTTNTCIITGLTNGLTYTTNVVAHAADSSCDSEADEDSATPQECNTWDDPTLTFSSNSLTVGGAHATASITGTQHGTLSFTSSDETVLTVNSTTGEVTAIGAGTATVTANWTAADGYCEKSVISGTFTIIGSLTITFHANYGDTPATTTQTVTYSVAVTLDANTFARTGYTFTGWATSADGEKAYDDQQQATFTHATTLYAVWEINSHSVTFTPSVTGATVKVNNSTTSPVSQVNYGSTVTIAITPADHYVISSLTVSGTGGAVAVNGTGDTRTFVMPDQDVTVALSMVEESQYTATFIDRGETFGSGQTAYADDNITAPETPDACEGYTFVGWVTATQADETTTRPEVVTFPQSMPVGGITFYALYCRTEGGNGGEASVSFKTASADGNTAYTSDSDIKTNIVDSYTGISSFEGSKTYPGKNGVKIGSSKANGYITLNLSAPITTNQITVVASKYGIDAGKITVTVNGSTAFGSEQSPSDGTLTFTDDDVEISSLTVATTSLRAYVASISLGGGGTSYYTTTPECAVCENQVTITKGEEDHGTFTLSKANGSYDNCKKNVSVTVSNITPEEGYYCTGVTATGSHMHVAVSGPDDSGNYTVAYAKGYSITSIINVVFEPLPTYTIRFIDNGSYISTQTVYEGASASKPADPTPCNEYSFVGWWTEEINPETADAELWITDDITATQNQDYYAVYSYSKTSTAGSGSTTTYYTTAPNCEAPIVTADTMLVAEYGGARIALAHDNTNIVAALPMMYFNENYICPDKDKQGNPASAPEKDTLTWQVAERTDGYYIKSGDKFLAATTNGFTLTDQRFLWSKDGGTRLAYDATTEKFVADQQGELPGIMPVDIPSSISLTELKSQRDLTKGNFGTICLPHAVALPFTWGVRVYSIEAKKINDKDELSGIYIVEETEMLTAGKPYLIEAKETQMTMWYPTGAETVTETISALGLVGNLSTKSVYVPVGCYGISNNQLRRVAAENTATIGQYKAYIDLTEVPVEGVGISMHSKYKVLYTAEGENVATDTEQLFDATGINWNEPVYNILGIRVDRNCTGVLIQNGKKFLVTHPRP